MAFMAFFSWLLQGQCILKAEDDLFEFYLYHKNSDTDPTAPTFQT